MKCILLIIFLIVLTCVNAQTDAEYIIAKHYEVTKTPLLIAKINSFEAQVVFEQNHIIIPVNIKGKMPDKFRTDMEINELNLIKISKEGKTTQYNPFTDSLFTVNSEKSPLLEFVKGWVAVIDTINNTNIEFVGIDKIEDIDVYQIKVDINKFSRTYFVDKLSYLVLRIDENTGKTTFFQDYRQLNEYVVPFRIIIYDEDKSNLTMQLKKIDLNPIVVDSVFDFSQIKAKHKF